MKTLKTILTASLLVLLVSSSTALAMTPYERAVELLSTINTPPAVTSYQLASSNTVCLDLTTDLSIADKGTKPDLVTKLQNFLYPKYLTEPATGYFGVLTDAAVKKLQAEYPREIEKPTGYVGPLTRSIIKSLSCTSTGAKSATTATDPAKTIAAYDSNSAWWLPPPPTTGTADPVKTTPTNTTTPNNTTTPTNTTTPPADCKQYEGVIPGDNRKVTLTTLKAPNKKYNYPMSAEGQAQHRSMFGYFGYIEHWFGGGTTQPAAFGNRPRMTIDSGRAFVVPFKTAAEYNYMPVVSTLTHETPETAEGVVAMSVSKCPGDFTSSFFAGTPDWQGNVTIPGTGQGKYCLSIAPSGSNQLDITVGNPGGFSCDLEPNTTYYFNITSGFSDTEGRKEGTMYPHIGKIGVGGTATTDGTFITPSSMVIDTISYDRSIRGRTSALERDNLELMKGKSEYYAEHRRIAGIVSAALQQRVVACRTAIGSGATRTGAECRGLPTPQPAYVWE